jgi:MFS family permease
MTFAVGVAAEAVALLLVGPSVDRIGRHNCVSLGQLLGGGACLACAMVRGGTMQAALAAVGKFGCAGGRRGVALRIAAACRFQHARHAAVRGMLSACMHAAALPLPSLPAPLQLPRL